MYGWLESDTGGLVIVFEDLSGIRAAIKDGPYMNRVRFGKTTLTGTRG